ncbi:hypothetical protein N7501_004196 [Penicillium viridicatum]|nr:hypothetical protein N7501_004196 [Penicillium viridicatum]
MVRDLVSSLENLIKSHKHHHHLSGTRVPMAMICIVVDREGPRRRSCPSNYNAEAAEIVECEDTTHISDPRGYHQPSASPASGMCTEWPMPVQTSVIVASSAMMVRCQSAATVGVMASYFRFPDMEGQCALACLVYKRIETRAIYSTAPIRFLELADGPLVQRDRAATRESWERTCRWVMEAYPVTSVDGRWWSWLAEDEIALLWSPVMMT